MSSIQCEAAGKKSNPVGERIASRNTSLDVLGARHNRCVTVAIGCPNLFRCAAVLRAKSRLFKDHELFAHGLLLYILSLRLTRIK